MSPPVHGDEAGGRRVFFCSGRRRQAVANRYVEERCGNRTALPAMELTRDVMGEIEALLGSPFALARAVRDHAASLASRWRRLEQRLRPVLRDREALEEERRRLALQHRRGALSDAEYEAEDDELRTRLAALDKRAAGQGEALAELERLRREQEDLGPVIEALESADPEAEYDLLADLWEVPPGPGAWERLARLADPALVVHGDGRVELYGRLPGFAPERLAWVEGHGTPPRRRLGAGAANRDGSTRTGSGRSARGRARSHGTSAHHPAPPRSAATCTAPPP